MVEVMEEKKVFSLEEYKKRTNNKLSLSNEKHIMHILVVIGKNEKNQIAITLLRLLANKEKNVEAEKSDFRALGASKSLFRAFKLLGGILKETSDGDIKLII